MKILVTGGAGFIASHIVDAYISEGHEVAVVDNLSTGFEKNIHPQAKFYKGDIRDQAFLKNVFEEVRPEVVNHHAAQMDVRVSTREPKLDAEINIIGSINLLLLAVEFHVRKFIYISTGGAVYGEPDLLPVSEDNPINPLSQYGISKHTVEHYLFLYSQNYGLNYTVLRYPNVFGPRQNPNGEAGVIAIFGLKLLNNEQAVIFGDGSQTRDYVYVSDIVQANLKATYAKEKGIFNIGSGKGTSVLELHKRICEILNIKSEPIMECARTGEIKHVYLNAAKAQALLDWTPLISLEEGMTKTVMWLKEQIF